MQWFKFKLTSDKIGNVLASEFGPEVGRLVGVELALPAAGAVAGHPLRQADLGGLGLKLDAVWWHSVARLCHFVLNFSLIKKELSEYFDGCFLSGIPVTVEVVL